MTNLSWHPPLATDSTPSHGAPSAMPTSQPNSKFSLKKHARVRGNLVYVDDVLMKSSSVEDHLKEIDHVLDQLTTAGAKIALHKGQWCKTKVNYVGLLVGRNGIELQSNRAQAIQSIKTPTNVIELWSFLGVQLLTTVHQKLRWHRTTNNFPPKKGLTLRLDESPGHSHEPAQTVPVLCSLPFLPRPRKIILSGRWIL